MYPTKSDVIRVRLAQKNDEIDQHADAEQTSGTQPDDACTDLALIEAVNTQTTKEQAQQNCDPLILGSAEVNSTAAIIVVIIVVIIDDDRLIVSRIADFLNLAAAVCADNCLFRNWLTAVLAELGRTLNGLLHLGLVGLIATLLGLIRLLILGLIALGSLLILGLIALGSLLILRLISTLNRCALGRLVGLPCGLIRNALLRLSSLRSLGSLGINLSRRRIAPTLGIIAVSGLCQADS